MVPTGYRLQRIGEVLDELNILGTLHDRRVHPIERFHALAPVHTGVVRGSGVINSGKGANYITSRVALGSVMRLWDLDYDPDQSSLRFSL